MSFWLSRYLFLGEQGVVLSAIQITSYFCWSLLTGVCEPRKLQVGTLAENIE